MEKQSDPRSEKWRHKCYQCGEWYDAPKGEPCACCNTWDVVAVRPSLERPAPDPTPEEVEAAREYLTKIYITPWDQACAALARLLASRRVEGQAFYTCDRCHTQRPLEGEAPVHAICPDCAKSKPVSPDAAEAVVAWMDCCPFSWDEYGATGPAVDRRVCKSLTALLESFAAGKVAAVVAERDALREREKEAREWAETVMGFYECDDTFPHKKETCKHCRAKAWLAGGGE